MIKHLLNYILIIFTILLLFVTSIPLVTPKDFSNKIVKSLIQQKTGLEPVFNENITISFFPKIKINANELKFYTYSGDFYQTSDFELDLKISDIFKNLSNFQISFIINNIPISMVYREKNSDFFISLSSPFPVEISGKIENENEFNNYKSILVKFKNQLLAGNIYNNKDVTLLDFKSENIDFNQEIYDLIQIFNPSSSGFNHMDNLPDQIEPGVAIDLSDEKILQKKYLLAIAAKNTKIGNFIIGEIIIENSEISISGLCFHGANCKNLEKIPFDATNFIPFSEIESNLTKLYEISS